MKVAICRECEHSKRENNGNPNHIVCTKVWSKNLNNSYMECRYVRECPVGKPTWEDEPKKVKITIKMEE